MSQTAWEHLTETMSSFKHQTCPVVNISVTKRLSVVLLALVNADYRFRCIQVEQAMAGCMHLGDVPYAMVADAAFPLKPYLMRPYAGQNRETSGVPLSRGVRGAA